MKDSVGLCVFLMVFAILVFFAPNFLGDANNFIPANPLQTPADIVPEWYFLPFYAILRSVPNKLLRRLLMFGSILVLFVLPWLDTSPVRSARFRPLYRQFIWSGSSRDRARRCRRAQAGGHLGGAEPGRARSYYFLHFLVSCRSSASSSGRCRCRKASAARSRRRGAVPSRRRGQADGEGVMRALRSCCTSLPRRARPRLARRRAQTRRPTPPAENWSFDGPFGAFDLAAAQRGFQVYSEVCSTCHSMQHCTTATSPASA